MVYKLKPIYFDKIWGGNTFKEKYHYDCSDTCGEAWGISGHINGSSLIVNGNYRGKTLAQLYETNRILFGDYPSDHFPILVKLIDAKEDLSIQVHPDNDYAMKHHNTSGKTESWYILDTEPNTKIIIGHNMVTKEQFEMAVNANDFLGLINKYDIKKDDLFLIKSGTIHAICKGTLLLEIQQPSDMTYRFYDYDRLENGSPRDLHLDRALDVVNIPDLPLIRKGESDYFTIDILSPQNELNISHYFGDYYFIVEGKGQFDDLVVEQGDFLFIPSRNVYQISGELKVVKMNIK